MFVTINVYLKNGQHKIVDINPFQVTHYEMYNPINVDEGTMIYLKTGEKIFTVDPFDELKLRIDRAIERFGGLLVISVIGEYVNSMDEIPVQIPKKRASSRTPKN